MATCVRVACQPAAGVPVAPKGKPLIHTNKQRVKSNEVLAREYEVLKQIYKERDSRQGKGASKPTQLVQSANSNTTSGEISPEVVGPKPSERAAEVLGRDRRTLNKAATVVKQIDKLASQGNPDGADALRATLNKSVDRAYKQVKAADVIVPVQEPEEERAVVVDRAAAMLAQCRTPVEAKRVADLAKAAEVYARLQKSGEEAVAHARAICIDALALMGEMLKQVQKNVGAKGSIVTGSKREPVKDDAPTLEEQGISKKQSMQAQALATVKEKVPEVYAEIKGGKLGVAAALTRRSSK